MTSNCCTLCRGGLGFARAAKCQHRCSSFRRRYERTTPSCGRGIWSIAVIDSRVSIAARDIADLDRSEVVHWLRQTNDRDVMLRFAEVPRGTCERLARSTRVQ